MVGAAAYAKYDTGFRKTIEENVPYSDRALDVVIGTKIPSTSPPTPVKSSKKAEQESLLKKKLEREKPEMKIKSQEPQMTKPSVTQSNDNVAPLMSIPKPEIPPSVASKLTTSNLLSEDRSKSSSDQSATPQSSSDDGGLNRGSSISPRTIVPKDEKNKSGEKTRKDPKEELREQLKIQLSAYSDYLKEQLQLQESELKRMHSIALEERILEEKMTYQRELATSIERLREVERILQGMYCWFPSIQFV